MKFVSFEDTTGIYETVFFPKVYHRYCYMLNATRPYILKGKVERDFGAITITVNWIGFLDKYKREVSRRPKPTTPKHLSIDTQAPRFYTTLILFGPCPLGTAIRPVMRLRSE